ncbi:MAG: BRCT domain-containing protein [Magnetococcales bacterium]|nr:BRCT domain-containing protein [Magnetococcales bacterium]
MLLGALQLEIGNHMEEPIFKNRYVAISGNMEYMTREQAVVKLLEVGAKPVDMVHKQTDLLIVGKRPCWKRKQALELGIPMIVESDFLYHLIIEGKIKL